MSSNKTDIMHTPSLLTSTGTTTVILPESPCLPLPGLAQDVLAALNTGGEPATRVVGGWVRSWLRSERANSAEQRLLPRTECDLATRLTPEDAEIRLKEAGFTVTDPGRRWGTLTVLAPRHAMPDDEGLRQVEIATLRQDTYLAGSRYPTVNWTDDWAQDAARRDLTCNAVYLSSDGTIFDPYGGAEDLAAGLMRFIGDPHVRIAEDPLRWLRFLRFCATYGTSGLTPEMVQVLVATAPGLQSLSRPKVTLEWQKLQRGVWAGSVLEILRQNQLLPLVQARLEPHA